MGDTAKSNWIFFSVRYAPGTNNETNVEIKGTKERDFQTGYL